MSKTNYLGVRCTKSNRYEAVAYASYRYAYMGVFDTPEQAAVARDVGVLKLCDPPTRGLVKLNFPDLREKHLDNEGTPIDLPWGYADKFWRSLVVEDDCWICRSSQLTLNGKKYGVRQIAWAVEYGVILPYGPYSSCGRLRCVRPEHLFNPSVDLKTMRDHEDRKAKAIAEKMSKLTKLQRQAIKESSQSLSMLAKKYGVSRTTISNIKNGK